MPLKILSLLSFTISFAGICLIFGLAPASVKKDLEKMKEIRDLLNHEIEITREIPKIDDKQKRI